ncbi:MAG: hypothetical protein L0211_12205 [Planctomycetaceae bacterium]|nr:hypothetical protein [Planctomycetaceae bacterium]
MVTPNEFWLALHALAEAYEAEGLSSDERSENIMNQLRRMPPTVRRQVLIDMRQLSNHLEDLFATACTTAYDAERDEQLQAQGKAS